MSKYILMVKPPRNKCFVVKSETSRFGWKRWHDNGWKVYDVYETWEESQVALREVKSGVRDAAQLDSLIGAWKR